MGWRTWVEWQTLLTWAPVVAVAGMSQAGIGLESAWSGSDAGLALASALLAGPLAQFGRSGIVQDLVARLATDFARRLEHSLTTGEDAPQGDTSLNPVALFFAVVKARISSALGRLFGSGK